ARRGEPLPPEARGDPLLDRDAQLAPTALSRDPAVVEQFKGDTLAYKGTIPLLILEAYVTAQSKLAAAAPLSLALPTLYLHGSEDPVIPYRGSVETLARLVPDDLEVRVFPGARHSIYNEINREEILDVLHGFLTRVAA
ncbi:MAG: alpha/beta fold hydrolase, partial [Solirubrobacteraceae bacterium]